MIKSRVSILAVLALAGAATACPMDTAATATSGETLLTAATTPVAALASYLVSGRVSISETVATAGKSIPPAKKAPPTKSVKPATKKPKDNNPNNNYGIGHIPPQTH